MSAMTMANIRVPSIRGLWNFPPAKPTNNTSAQEVKSMIESNVLTLVEEKLKRFSRVLIMPIVYSIPRKKMFKLNKG